MTADVYLGSVGVALGVPLPISELESITRDEVVLAYLLGKGLTSYRKATLSPPELAAEALAATLSRSPIGAASIDSVIYASTSFQQRDWYTGEVSQLLCRLGLARSSVVGVTLSECGNFVPALRVAVGLVRDGMARHVLLVTTDVSPSPGARLVPPMATVLSDGAASCLISSDPLDGWRVVATSQVSNHHLRLLDPAAQTAKVARLTEYGVRAAARGSLAVAGVAPEGVTRLVLTNQNRAILEGFAAACEVPLDRVVLNTLLENGHVFAADPLINLDACEQEVPGSTGTVLVVANGTCTWGTAVLIRSTN